MKADKIEGVEVMEKLNSLFERHKDIISEISKSVKELKELGLNIEIKISYGENK